VHPYREPVSARGGSKAKAGGIEELAVHAALVMAGAIGIASALIDPNRTTAGAVGLLMTCWAVVSLIRSCRRRER
jgi:hypothetical protein